MATTSSSLSLVKTRMLSSPVAAPTGMFEPVSLMVSEVDLRLLLCSALAALSALCFLLFLLLGLQRGEVDVPDEDSF